MYDLRPHFAQVPRGVRNGGYATPLQDATGGIPDKESNLGDRTRILALNLGHLGGPLRAEKGLYEGSTTSAPRALPRASPQATNAI